MMQAYYIPKPKPVLFLSTPWARFLSCRIWSSIVTANMRRRTAQQALYITLLQTVACETMGSYCTYQFPTYCSNLELSRSGLFGHVVLQHDFAA